MAKTFAENVVETSQTIGTSPYELDGEVLGHRSFVAAGFTTGDRPQYVVRNRQNTKYEFNRGAVFTNADPDTLARGVYLSSNSNSPVVWTSQDLPLTIYVPTLNRTSKRTRVQTGAKVQITNASLPFDDSVPQNTEGAAVAALDLPVVVESESSRIQIKAKLMLAYDSTVPSSNILALFVDSEASALSVTTNHQDDTQTVVPLEIDVEVPNPGVGAHTYKVRIGSSQGAGGTFTLNGANNTARFGGTYNSFIECMEIFDV